MLKEDSTASFLNFMYIRSRDDITFMVGSRPRRGNYKYWANLRLETIERIKMKSKTMPTRVPNIKRASGAIEKHWWYWNEKFFVTEENLKKEDVKALILERDNIKRLKLEKAHALQAMREQLDSKLQRQAIPQAVKVSVWQRDKGRCIECESNKELEYDHIIPLSMGGSNTARNLQLLCAICNRRKGGTLG